MIHWKGSHKPQVLETYNSPWVFHCTYVRDPRMILLTPPHQTRRRSQGRSGLSITSKGAEDRPTGGGVRCPEVPGMAVWLDENTTEQ